MIVPQPADGSNIEGNTPPADTLREIMSCVVLIVQQVLDCGDLATTDPEHYQRLAAPPGVPGRGALPVVLMPLYVQFYPYKMFHVEHCTYTWYFSQLHPLVLPQFMHL